MSCVVCRNTPGVKCPEGRCDPLSQKRLNTLAAEINPSQHGMEVAVLNRDDGESVQALIEFYRKMQLHQCHVQVLQDCRGLFEYDAAQRRHLLAIAEAGERYISGKCLLNELVETTQRYAAWKDQHGSSSIE